MKNDDKECAETIERSINTMSISPKQVAKELATMHPTLQQTFMNIAVQFIREMSQKTYADGRNEASVELAKKIMANLDYEDKEGLLPFI